MKTINDIKFLSEETYFGINMSSPGCLLRVYCGTSQWWLVVVVGWSVGSSGDGGCGDNMEHHQGFENIRENI